MSIIHSWIHKKLREKIRIDIVRTHELKEKIFRIIIKKGGVPRCFVYDIIKDMEKEGLIKRLDHTKYKILTNKNDKRLRKYP